MEPTLLIVNSHRKEYWFSDKGKYNSGNIQKAAVCRADGPVYISCAQRIGGGQAGESKKRRNGRSENDGTERPKGYFFAPMLCTRVKIRNLCGHNTGIEHNATYNRKDSRAFCGVPALSVYISRRGLCLPHPGRQRHYTPKYPGVPGYRGHRECGKYRDGRECRKYGERQASRKYRHT